MLYGTSGCYLGGMSDEPTHERPERRGTQPPNPIVKPGETMLLSEILKRIPLADAALLRDVDEAQAGAQPGR